jgi:transcriptional regulator with XRE-family HTH domain
MCGVVGFLGQGWCGDVGTLAVSWCCVLVEQADLAAAMGYSTTATVSLIERVKKGIPLRRLEAAAQRLGVAPEVITGTPAFYDRLVLSDPFTVVAEPTK